MIKKKLIYFYPQYTDRNVSQHEHLDPSIIQLEAGCGCTSSRCNPDTCPCFNRFKSPHYITNQNNHFVLNPAYLEGSNNPPIYECNAFCPCSQKCSNRIVQTGIKELLIVGSHPQKGMKVTTGTRLQKGQFVCEYAGEVLTNEEAEIRVKEGHVMNYLISVRENLYLENDVITHVDPRHHGNAGRFINHSCCPNLKMYPVRGDHDITPMLALFAVREIPIGEELTFDYNDGVNWEIPKNKTNLTKCHCGSSNCREYLPLNTEILK